MINVYLSSESINRPSMSNRQARMGGSFVAIVTDYDQFDTGEKVESRMISPRTN